ncbi:hypothetical protein A7U60_g1284 [Sanghuangporus baumii]|uniref:Uncharacterized protein n=1 Tax=Sanghuangporus baumii TaxID=108892 RepID=A0A9Q5N9C2_SANBA|nr:hypothetical protein A7U60_g1284 [Sanghuangporus baumii]
MLPSSPPTLTSERAKLVWLAFDEGVGSGRRNLLPVPDEFALPPPPPPLPSPSPPGEKTKDERDPSPSPVLALLHSAGESVAADAVGLLAENKLGSEKSGKASSETIELVSTVRRTGCSPPSPVISPPAEESSESLVVVKVIAVSFRSLCLGIGIDDAEK